MPEISTKGTYPFKHILKGVVQLDPMDPKSEWVAAYMMTNVSNGFVAGGAKMTAEELAVVQHPEAWEDHKIILTELRLKNSWRQEKAA